MIGERQLAPFKTSSQAIEHELTGGWGYNSSALQPKGAENYISLEIHLGEMKRAAKGLTYQESTSLIDLYLWRQSIATAGVEDNLRFYSLDAIDRSLETYKVNMAKLGREKVEQPARTCAGTNRLRRIAMTASRVGVGSVATVSLAALSGILWIDHVQQRHVALDQRDTAVRQLKTLDLQYEAATVEEKRKNLEDAQPLIENGKKAQAKINDMDEWNSFGSAARGFELILAPLATLGAGLITVDSAKGRR